MNPATPEIQGKEKRIMKKLEKFLEEYFEICAHK